MTVEEYFGDWSRVVDTGEADRVTRLLLNSKVPTCPRIKDLFRTFEVCGYDGLRVVVLGQDPYPQLRSDGTPVAQGLAFANAKDTSEKNYSSSLKVLMNSLIDFSVPHKTINFDPSLESIGKQGVLWLNTALSCETGKTGSHSLLWRPFMKSLLTSLSKCKTGIVYVLMGTEAQGFEPCINPRFNHVIRCRHPAYYARAHTEMPSGTWYQVNRILMGQNGLGIKWYEEV